MNRALQRALDNMMWGIRRSPHPWFKEFSCSGKEGIRATSGVITVVESVRSPSSLFQEIYEGAEQGGLMVGIDTLLGSANETMAENSDRAEDKTSVRQHEALHVGLPYFNSIRKAPVPGLGYLLRITRSISHGCVMGTRS